VLLDWKGDLPTYKVGLNWQPSDNHYVLTIEGSENPFSPQVTYFASFDYAFNLSGGGTLTPSLSFNHSDATYTNTLQEPDNDYYRTEDRDIANFSLTYDKEDWNVQFFVNNLTDELFIEGSDGGSVLYGDPQVVGFRARRGF
jgi:outer membrane receptor protein involved in Fe transport